MKPVDQTTFGMPHGNCLSACVASILELPLAEVPWFNGDWPRDFERWLRARGLYSMTINYAPDVAMPPVPYILGGQSPRGSHAVVAVGHGIVHDPHPSRAGLVVREDLILLVPLDLARWAHVAAPRTEELAHGR